ncbi:hypothetical protein [Polaromonas sp. YR568]|nr:hypothetical protein [Polaromonas sp. YR568]
MTTLHLATPLATAVYAVPAGVRACAAHQVDYALQWPHQPVAHS